MTRRSPGRSSKKRGGPWSISPTAGGADTSIIDVSLTCAAANAKQLKQQSEQITQQKINERLDGVDHRAARQKRPRRWLRYAVAMNQRRCRDWRGASHVMRNPREVVRSPSPNTPSNSGRLGVSARFEGTIASEPDRGSPALPCHRRGQS